MEKDFSKEERREGRKEEKGCMGCKLTFQHGQKLTDETQTI